MRLLKYIEEEMTTATVGELDADAVTSNKIIRVELKNDKIRALVNKLKKKKDVTVTMDNGIATIDIPYEVPKSLMSKLSHYTV